MDLIRKHQFGRIENISILAGQPIFDRDVKVVRVARLGGERDGTTAPNTDECELKQAVCHLFDELVRLGDGVIVRLEFRHGLPFLLETAIPATRGEQLSGPVD